METKILIFFFFQAVSVPLFDHKFFFLVVFIEGAGVKAPTHSTCRVHFIFSLQNPLLNDKDIRNAHSSANIFCCGPVLFEKFWNDFK